MVSYVSQLVSPHPQPSFFFSVPFLLTVSYVHKHALSVYFETPHTKEPHGSTMTEDKRGLGFR